MSSEAKEENHLYIEDLLDRVEAKRQKQFVWVLVVDGSVRGVYRSEDSAEKRGAELEDAGEKRGKFVRYSTHACEVES